jgi:hypothetical protein
VDTALRFLLSSRVPDVGVAAGALPRRSTGGVDVDSFRRLLALDLDPDASSSSVPGSGIIDLARRGSSRAGSKLR